MNKSNLRWCLALLLVPYVLTLWGCDAPTNAPQSAGPSLQGATPSQPLPTGVGTALSEPTFPPPLATLPGPDTGITPTTARANWDLRSLAFNAEVIAIVTVTSGAISPEAALVDLKVEEWIKNTQAVTETQLLLTMRPQDWAAMPPSFKENATRAGNRYFMFLSSGRPANGRKGYYMMGAVSGAFLIKDGRVVDAPNSEYEGWTVERFREGIVADLPPTPTPYIREPATTRAPGGPPVALVQDGDGLRIDVYEGNVGFGGGPSPWLGPSRLLVQWAPAGGTSESTYNYYIVDVAKGKLEGAPSYLGGWSTQMFPQADGKHMVLISGNGEDEALHVKFVEAETGHTQSVYSAEPGVEQWAGDDTHGWDIRGLQIYATALWVDQDTFVLRIQPINDSGIRDWGTKLLLVDTAQHRVSVLTAKGELAALYPDGSVMWRSGWWDGELLLLAPPYEGKPQQVSAGGPWTQGWSVSPDGRKVAWLEMTPPPGDWSRRLPSVCCNGEPPPVPEAITLWDRPTGRKERFPVTGFAWPRAGHGITWDENVQLKWRSDSAAILYGGHADSAHTALYELRLDGAVTLLSQHDGYGGLQVLRAGNDGSVYYATHNLACEYCEQLLRRYPDGKVEIVLEKDQFFAWSVQDNLLETLYEGGVRVQDLRSGDGQIVYFPQEQVGNDQLGWSFVENLAPLSPDGRWVAYAGSNSDSVMVGPDGRAWDRGRVLRIVPTGIGTRK